MILLFNFEFIDIKLTAPNENSIILQKKSDNLCKIIENGMQIRNFIKMINQLDIRVISYTAKNKKSSAQIYNAIDPNILNSWIFIEQDNKKYKQIMPNRAFLSECNSICFGQYFSSNSLKTDIRLAIHCALKQFNRNKFIIIQKSPQQLQTLKKQKEKYIHIFKDINIQKQQLQQLINQQKQIMIPKITFPEHQTHRIQNLFSANREISISRLFEPKFSFSITPVGRTFNSKSICNLIFVNSLNKHLYILKTDKIKEVGGQLYSEQLQNIEFASQLAGFLLIKFLRHWKGFSLTLKSLISIYDRKKANHIIKPYVNNLCIFSQKIHGSQQIEKLLSTGKFDNKTVKGLGKILVFGLLCGETYHIKSFLEQIGYIDDENIEIIQCIKYDCNRIFENIYQETDDIQFLRISEFLPNYDIRKLSQTYLSQIREMLLDVQMNLQTIQGIFNHYKWQFPKYKLYQTFKKRHELLMYIFKCSPQEQSKDNSIQVSPMQYRLLVGTDFSYFYKLPNQFEIQYRKENIYLQLIRSDPSFQIHTNTPKLNLLLRYLSGKYQVYYISFLTSTKEQYEILIKKVKSKAQNQKKHNHIIVVDHAQLYEDIAKINRPIKTIFISRLKKLQCPDLQIIDEQFILKQNLMQSQQQYFQTLLKGCTISYQLYATAIRTWIFDKADFYKLSKQKSMKLLEELVDRITSSKNRFSQFSQNKEIYCLPVGKYKQRIYLHHDIYQFLHAKYLIEKILEGCWLGQLQSNQMQHFEKWVTLYPKKQKIIENLWQLSAKITDRQRRCDVLQMLSFLGEINNITLSECLQFNYSSIQLVKSISSQKYIVCSKKNIYEYYWDPYSKIQANSYSSRCFDVLDLTDRRLLLIASDFEQNDKIMQLKTVEISDQNLIDSGLKLTSLQKSIDQNFLFLNENTILSFSCQTSTLHMLAPKQKILNKWENPIKSIIRLDNSQVIVYGMNFISVFDVISSSDQIIFKHEGDIQQVQLYQYQQKSILLINIRQPNLIAIISIKGQILCQISSVKPISCTAFDKFSNLLFTSEQNDDSMLVYTLNRTETGLEPTLLKKYYQIMLNPHKILAYKKSLLLIGQGFIKKYNIEHLFKKLKEEN